MASTSAYHAPVLAEVVLGYLRLCQRVLDCTVGGGGHSLALLEAGVAEVVGIDCDPAAIHEATTALRGFVSSGRFRILRANYAHVDQEPVMNDETFDGILLDLGVSSHQLDDQARGFSFRPGAPLDMRMGSEGPTAAEWLNGGDEHDLAGTFREYADEMRAMKLAHAIVRRRATREFAT